MRSTRRWAGAAALGLWVGACAPAPTPVTAPTAPRYADFVFPISPETADAALVARLRQGWFRLQAGDLRGADRDVSAVLKRAPGFAPAGVAAAYLDIAHKRFGEALSRTEGVLATVPTYAPALSARGEALLALRRPADALASFEAAVAADPSLVTVARRVEVLRFRAVEQLLGEARASAAAGRTADARDAYARAIRESPDSAILYGELAALERRAGDTAAAREHLRKAVALDPEDARAQADLGDVLERAEDYAGAVVAYRASLAAEPNEEIQARLERAEARTHAARLPAEYRAIAGAPQISRADLAALIGVRFETALKGAPRRRVAVMTDVGGHWAAAWILEAARAGVIDPLPNHTFQPRGRVRRGELATALSRLLGIVLAGRPDPPQASANAAPRIADVSPSHLMSAAVSSVVAAGVLPLLPGDTFQVSRPVPGAEAIAALDRIQALATGAHRP